MHPRLLVAGFLAIPLLLGCQTASTASVPTATPTTPPPTVVPSMTGAPPSGSPGPTATASPATSSPAPSGTRVTRPAFALAVPAGWRVDSSQTDDATAWRAQIAKGEEGALQFVRVEASRRAGKTAADADKARAASLDGECPGGTAAAQRSIAGSPAKGISCGEGEMQSVHYFWVANARLYTLTHLAEGEALDGATLTRVLAGLTLTKA